MKKVITYGSYDLLHQGHINLLKRAKELGDYLIVGVTSEDFDITRGKINVKQTLVERMQAVRDTGYADLVIPEEYPGQKIDDIRNYGIDIFTVGSDWEGYFDYLREYCEVIYLDRTEGVSSTQLRNERGQIALGIIGDSTQIKKFIEESKYINGLTISGILLDHEGDAIHDYPGIAFFADEDDLLSNSDAVYIANDPSRHYETSKTVLSRGKHALCESPIALSKENALELFSIADKKGVVFYEAIKTAYALAFSRMLLLAKSNHIGRIKSVDAVCTSLAERARPLDSIIGWGPIAALGVFSVLGIDYEDAWAASYKNESLDVFTRINFLYENAVASLTVANGVKSEGSLTISGTKGYIYIPSPWWKTDYFEIRYEDATKNKRYFYQLEGEGIRFEIAAFSRAALASNNQNHYISRAISAEISELIGSYLHGTIPIAHLQ